MGTGAWTILVLWGITPLTIEPVPRQWASSARIGTIGSATGDRFGLDGLVIVD